MMRIRSLNSKYLILLLPSITWCSLGRYRFRNTVAVSLITSSLWLLASQTKPMIRIRLNWIFTAWQEDPDQFVGLWFDTIDHRPIGQVVGQSEFGTAAVSLSLRLNSPGLSRHFSLKTQSPNLSLHDWESYQLWETQSQHDSIYLGGLLSRSLVLEYKYLT